MTPTKAEQVDTIRKLRKALKWSAQTVHQSYHTDQRGSWRDCPKNHCASIRYELGMSESPVKGTSTDD